MQNGATPNRLIPSNKLICREAVLFRKQQHRPTDLLSLWMRMAEEQPVSKKNRDQPSKEEFFDLQGRRVMKPSKGIFVTKSGKKVLFF